MTAYGQFDFGVGFEPEPSEMEAKAKEIEKETRLPYALAVEKVVSSATWESVGLSTAPALELIRLMFRGYYKTELIEMVLLADKANIPLHELVKERDKGRSLSGLAAEHKLDEAALYEEALSLRAKADALQPFVSVSTGTLQGDATGTTIVPFDRKTSTLPIGVQPVAVSTAPSVSPATGANP